MLAQRATFAPRTGSNDEIGFPYPTFVVDLATRLDGFANALFRKLNGPPTFRGVLIRW